MELTAAEAESLIKQISPELDCFTYESIFPSERNDICVVIRSGWSGNYNFDTIYLVWKNKLGVRCKKIKNFRVSIFQELQGERGRVFFDLIEVRNGVVFLKYNLNKGAACCTLSEIYLE